MNTDGFTIMKSLLCCALTCRLNDTLSSALFNSLVDNIPSVRGGGGGGGGSRRPSWINELSNTKIISQINLN